MSALGDFWLSPPGDHLALPLARAIEPHFKIRGQRELSQRVQSHRSCGCGQTSHITLSTSPTNLSHNNHVWTWKDRRQEE
eukprot:4073205-Pyramimonas_sp.AAC.1